MIVKKSILITFLCLILLCVAGCMKNRKIQPTKDFHEQYPENWTGSNK